MSREARYVLLGALTAAAVVLFGLVALGLGQH